MRGLIDKKKRNMINKKGAAHFEMIFSFVFFVGFVFFLFTVLKPQDTSTLSGSVIEALYDSFEDEVHTNLSSTFLKVNSSEVTETCFKIALPGEVFVYALTDSYVVELDGVEANSKVTDPSDLEIANVSDFFRVAISPEFTDDSFGVCTTLTDYKLGSILERRVVSYSSLVIMQTEYDTNYEGLKTKLRVPPIFDFAIVAENMTEVNMEPSSGVPDSPEVQARGYVVEVLKSDGSIINERFSLWLW